MEMWSGLWKHPSLFATPLQSDSVLLKIPAVFISLSQHHSLPYSFPIPKKCFHSVFWRTEFTSKATPQHKMASNSCMASKMIKANQIIYTRTTSSLITETKESFIYLPWKVIATVRQS